MSSDMALSGLASGFDWQPVVEQLIELEAVPQKRLQYEKQQNEDKISELGRLKSQLDALKSASTALQNNDLFEARRGALDEDAGEFLGVRLDPGSMTGSYKVEVVSLGSPTIMSSKLRKPNGLGSSLYMNGSDPSGLKPVDIALQDLPLQTAITLGTFTIAGRSFEITSLSETLSDLIARISSDFEEDGTVVSIEYNPDTDKIIVDGGQLTTDPNYKDTPILGSPTDSSNFLKVLRLLDQVSTTRDADYEGGSGISIWSGALSVLTSPETKAWIRPDDPDVNPGAADSRLFVAAGGPNGTDLLYRRKGHEALHNASTAYTDGQIVYKHGNLYKIKAGKNLSSAAYSQGVTSSASGTVVHYGSGANQGFWELQLDLETAKRDVYTPASHDPTGGAAYQRGDIVKISDGVGDHFFRAVKDRTEAGAVEWSAAQLTGGGGIKSMNDAGGANWTNNRPNFIKINGKLYLPTPITGGGKIVFGIPTVHTGAGDDTVYSTDQMVVGADGIAGVEDKYFKASNLWASITAHSGNGETTKYANGNVVQNSSDNKFYKATAAWTGVKDHSGVNDQTLYLQNDYVRESAAPNAYFKATAAWANVATHTGAADVTNSTTNDVVWRNMTGNKYFYKAKQDFASIATAATKKKYDDDAASIADKIVKNGSNFYQAKATVWDSITSHAEGSAVSGVSQNDVVQLSDGSAKDRFYKALSDLSLIAAHDAKVNYKPSETLDKKIVSSGGNYFQAAVDRAKEEFNAAGAGLSSAQVGGMAQNERALDTVSGKTFSAKVNLALIQAHNATVNYQPALGLGSEVVENGGQFYKFTHGDGKLAKHAFGAAGLSASDAMAMAVGERALDNVAGKAFSAKAALGTISVHDASINYAQNALIENGGDFFKAKLTNLAEATFNLAGGISSADLGNVANGDHLMDIGNGRVFSAKMALKDTIAHQADASYDPASGTLNNKLRTIGGLAGNFYKPTHVINFNNGFIDVSSYATTTSIVKDSGQYYQFSEAYAGRGGVATANHGEWVKSPTDNVFYKNTSGGALSTDPGVTPAGWTSSTGGQTTLAGMVAQGEMATNATTFVTDPSAAGNTLWTDATNDVTKPNAGGNDYWTHETDATAPGTNQPANAYWEKITSEVTNPVFGVANDFWTDEPLATTLGNNAFWTEVTDDVIKPTAATDYWDDVTAAVANFGNTTYWTNVTDSVSLDNQTLAGGDTAFWQDITDELVDFPAGSLISTYWDDVTNDISLTAPPPAGGSNAYWEDVTADLTDKSDPDFFGTWWTNATAEVTDESNGGFSTWWDDVDSDLTDLTKVGGAADLTDNYWTDITTEITDPNDAAFTNYWTEYAHLNGTTADPVGTASATGYDPEYWQMIDPGMKRLVNNGTGDVVATNAVDHTIWARAGNLAASAGDDGSFGTHDTNEDALKPATAVGTWTGLGTYGIGDLAKGSDGKYYQARLASNSGSPVDPTSAAGHDSWDLVGDSTKNDSFAYAFQYADTKFWEQVNLPEPGVGANWGDYWETLSETVLTSSQPLGSVDLTEKISNANFDGFSAANFPGGLGSFFIGDGTGAVRIDYDTANDSVSDLIARVNASEANVTMFYDPVGDRFVVQNNADGAIGINLHEDPDWDTLSANKGSGNILELMGLASPQDTSKYSVYSDSNAYVAGDLVKTTIGGSTTYWQATGTIAALAGDTPDIASSNWEQLGLGAGRAMTEELGNNFAIRVNDGELIYNNTSSFDETVHGYKGIDIDVSKGNVGDAGTFKVEHDITPVKNAVSKLVEEFNDAQDYLNSVVSVTQDGDNVTAGTFSSNIEISQLGSQLRKLVFGDSYAHSESGISDDGTNITVDDFATLNVLDDPGELNLQPADAGYSVKVKADETDGGNTNYYKYDGAGSWTKYTPQFTSFRLEDIGLDFGTGSNRVQVKDSSKLAEQLEANLEKVKALFAEATATADDKNTGKSNRQYQGITYDLNDFLDNFLSGDSQTGYKGAYKAHIDSLRAQNKRIDDRVEDMDRYLEQREETLSAGFIRMEEMQSKLNTQLQTLTNSFAKKS